MKRPKTVIPISLVNEATRAKKKARAVKREPVRRDEEEE
jgi:hypothetical protein